MPRKKKLDADPLTNNGAPIKKTTPGPGKTSKAAPRKTRKASTAKASASKTAGKKTSGKSMATAKKPTRLPGERLRECLSECSVAIDKAVATIAMVKLPLLKISAVLQTCKFPALEEITPQGVFLAPAIAGQLITASLAAPQLQDLREIFRHYAAVAEDEQIREGCIAALCCLELHVLSGWPAQQNPLLISLLHKSAGKFADYWPPQSLLPLVPELSNQEQLPEELLLTNGYFYKYITKSAIAEIEKLFITVNNGKYDQLWALAPELTIDRIDTATEVRELIRLTQNCITWQWEQKIYQIIAENSQLDAESRRILIRELDCFSCRDNPVLLLAVLRQQQKS